MKEGKLSQDKLNQIVDRTKKGGAEIVKYLEKGSAFYAPALLVLKWQNAILKI